MTDASTTSQGGARSAIALEYATIGVSAAEAIGALVSGVLAHSLALVAFGADSIIEMLSASVVLFQVRSLVSAGTRTPRSEHRAHRILAVLFFILAAYVVASALDDFVHAIHPSENVLGFVVCIASGVIMPALAFAKRRTSLQLTRSGFSSLGSLLASDAAETALCGWLSVSTLVGVGMTAWMGWWWADPVASLAVVYFALREGREAWECDPD